MKNTRFILTLSVVGALVLAPLSVLAAMSSANYTIYADSVGVDGTGLSTSANYSLEDTIGEPVAGIATSANYEARAGYQSMERADLSLTLSAASVSLGELSNTSVSSANVVATVTANALTGYTLSVNSVSANSITATVTDGEVTVGADEYGLAVSGGDSAFNNDKAVASGQTLASATSERVSSATTLTFKASRSTSATAGNYSQNVNLLLSANF